MNKHAAKIADDEMYNRHLELIDIRTGKRRPLTKNKADDRYRREWMMYYKAVDKADKDDFGECEVGGVKIACPPPAEKEWDQLEVLKILCTPEDRWAIDVLKHPKAKTLKSKRILYVDKKYNLDAAGNPVGDPIEANAFPAGGSNVAAKRLINIRAGTSSKEAAATIVHEARHQVQDKAKLGSWKEQEIDAYVVGEEFRIRKGLGPNAEGFQKSTPAGKVPDRVVIKAYVEKNYPFTPEWEQGDEITEDVTDMSKGWDCARVGK